MLTIPAPVEPTIADPPAPAPRDVAWASYVRRASDALAASESIVAEARGVLARHGTLDEFNLHLTALEVVYNELGAANAGLHALSDVGGVA